MDINNCDCMACESEYINSNKAQANYEKRLKAKEKGRKKNKSIFIIPPKQDGSTWFKGRGIK